MEFRIKENSLLAKLGAWKLRTKRMALTLGNTIHLYNASTEEFLDDPRWVRHELRHVQQYQEHGFFTFLWKYTIESIRHGYFDNRFEKEARAAETEA